MSIEVSLILVCLVLSPASVLLRLAATGRLVDGINSECGNILSYGWTCPTIKHSKSDRVDALFHMTVAVYRCLKDAMVLNLWFIRRDLKKDARAFGTITYISITIRFDGEVNNMYEWEGRGWVVIQGVMFVLFRADAMMMI